MAQRSSQSTAIIERFRLALEQQGIRPQHIYLFGSHAHGNTHEGSDIDLIVISHDWVRFNPRERLELLGVAAVRIMEPIQAQGFTPDEVANHQLGAFWEEILNRHAVPV